MACSASVKAGDLEHRLAAVCEVAARQLAAMTAYVERIEEHVGRMEKSFRSASDGDDKALDGLLGRMLVEPAQAAGKER